MLYKFRTEQSVDTNKEFKGQTFEKTQPVYRLNQATGELEKTDEVVDLQAVIDSCLETCLDRALERLMPKVETSEDVATLDLMRDDLDMAMEVCNIAEEYKEKYNLDASMSMEHVFDFVSKQAEALKTKIDAASKKEEIDVQTEDVEKSE